MAMELHAPEVLAPAGNWDCVRAAVANGANAVYFGLDKFNARMRADNFTRADLSSLVPFLHAHGLRAYVTMNVLIFTDEVEEALEYLIALDAAGVDAVIVQDVGLAAQITQWRREGRLRIALHISTQMTVTDPEGVRLVDELLDPEQIVTARELSLREIAACAKATKKPLEVFCQGALCVAYSGQCLTSESLGRRSANRGECAQACRMPYRLVVDGRPLNLGERRYLFSPQDLCALDRIPEMLEAGVRSFKIEGRLKSPEYVAAAVRAYRRALDAALAGRPVLPEERAADLYALQMAFSRGFSTGWLDGTNHPLLTHGRFGKKRGVLVGRIAACGEGWVELVELPPVPISPGDGFVVDAGQDRNEERGGRIWRASGKRLFFHGKGSNIVPSEVRPGCLLWKTADPALERSLHATWCNFARHAAEGTGGALDMAFSGRIGEALIVTCRGVSVRSERPLESAQNRPLTPEVIEAQFSRLGGTGYVPGHFTYAVEQGAMLPLSVLNRMRRELVAALPDASGAEVAASAELPVLPRLFPAPAPAAEFLLSVLCRTPEQARAAAASGVGLLYLDFTDISRYPDFVPALRAEFPDVQIALATLRIMKPHEEGYFKFYRAAQPDAVLVRNLGAARCFRSTGIPMIGDFSLNAANPLSVHFWQRFGMQAITVSYDLDSSQITDLLRTGCGPALELTLHQHIPLFHTEHCVFCTFLSEGHSFKDCGRPCEQHEVRMADRTGALHYLRSDEGCRNTLFNGRPQTAARHMAAFRTLGLARFRLELLAETAGETSRLIASYQALAAGRLAPEELIRRLHALDRVGVTEY